MNSTALGLTADQQQQLVDFVFSIPDLSQPYDALAPKEMAKRLRLLFPPFGTLYDTIGERDGVYSDTFSGIRSGCFASCMANFSGNQSYVPDCNAQCAWVCVGSPIGVNDPSYGLCNPSLGCNRTCGSPDWPMERYSTATNEADQLFTLSVSSMDVNGDGLIDYNELRGLLLHLYSNCTYRVMQTDPSVATTTRYCTLSGVGEFLPGQPRILGSLNCSFSTGNPSDWRINNLPPPAPPYNSTLNATAYGAYVSSLYGLPSGQWPNECRPFPDYDPR